MRKIGLLILSLFISVSIFSQFSIGAKVGYNTSLGFDQDWNFDKTSVNFKNDISNGFHVGLYARIGYAVYLQPEVLYNYSQFKMEFDSDSRKEVSKTVKTNSIDVPILLGYHLVNTNFFKFRVMVGPKLSFNIGSTKMESYNDILAMQRSTRIGLDTGIGIDIWRFSVDVRYNLMHNPYMYIDKSTDTKIKDKPNNSFAVSLGFRIQGNNTKRGGSSN